MRLSYLVSTLLLLPTEVQAFSSTYAADTILVLGANGFVGKEIVNQLKDLGIPHVAPGRTELDLTSVDAIEKTAQICKDNNCQAVISTVGSFGDKDDLKINASNGAAAKGAQQAGCVQRFVAVGNDPKVRAFSKNTFLKNYAQGKEESEQVIQACFPDTYTLVAPTLIHGGEDFSLNPPRIPDSVGGLVESLLGLYPVQSASEALPGVLGLALQAPISREFLAKACVNAALGFAQGNLDSRDAILKAAAKRPQKARLLAVAKDGQDLKQQLYNLGDCEGDPAKLEQAFQLLEQIEDCNIRKPIQDPSLNGRWDFVMDVEADIGTGVLKDIVEGNSPFKMVFDLKDLFMVIEDNQKVSIHVNTKVLGLPIDLKLTTLLIPEESDPTGTMFLEQFEGVELMGRQFPVPEDWQRARPLEFSYLDDTMLIARGNGAEPHYLKREP